jgi:hypothetical protein
MSAIAAPLRKVHKVGYAHEKLMLALGALTSAAPMSQRVEHALGHLRMLNDDDFDPDLREQWTEIRNAGDRREQMAVRDLEALAKRMLSLFLRVAGRDQLSRDSEAYDKARAELQAARERSRRRPTKKADTVAAMVMFRRRGSDKFEGAGRRVPRPPAAW